MRRGSAFLFVTALAAMPACSLLVDTSDLSGGPGDAGGNAKSDGGVRDAAAQDVATTNGDSSDRDGASTVDAAIPTCGVLAPGQELHQEDKVTSCNGKFFVIYQGDGNIVLYGRGADGALWATETYDKPVDHAVMQTNGDFVVLSGAGKPLYSTNTGTFPGAYFSVEDDGFVTVKSNGVERWRGQNY